MKIVKLSAFFKNVGVLSLSVALSQLFQILSLLVLAATVKQAEMGVYTIYLSLLSIVSSVGLLQYDQALVHMEDEKEKDVVSALLFLSLLSSAAVFVVSLVLSYPLGKLLSAHLFFSMLMLIAIRYMTRKRYFKRLAAVRVAPPAIFFLAVSFFSWTGLLSVSFEIVYIHLLSLSVVSIFSIAWVITHLEGISFSVSKIFSFFKEKREFAILTMPGTLINSFSYNIPTVIIGRFFGEAAAAQFFLALRGINVISILSTALYNVIHGTIAALYREGNREKIKNLIERYRKKMFFVSFAAMLAIISLSTLLEFFDFTAEWRDTLFYLQIMAPLAAITLFVVPLSSVFFVFERLGVDFFNNTTLLFLVIFSWGIAIFMHNIVAGVLLYTLLSIVRYFYILYKIKEIVK